MALELIYTSAPRGLRPGSRGFCTVAHTRGMAGELVDLCESLSGYVPAFPANDSRSALNPPAVSHLRVTLAGQPVSVLSRVAACGADYSGRANALAHHLVIPADEQAAAGPADLAAQPGLFLAAWSSEPRLFPDPRALPAPAPRPGFDAPAWTRLAGDPGWAGALAQTFLDQPQVPAFLVVEPDGADPLPLLAEALALVPPDRRWQVTFSTYFTFLPAGAACAWRCCLPESDALRKAGRFPDALVLTLSKLKGRQPPEGPLVRAARAGLPPPWARPAGRPALAGLPEITPDPTAAPAVTSPPPPPSGRPATGVQGPKSSTSPLPGRRLRVLAVLALAALSLGLLVAILALRGSWRHPPPPIPGPDQVPAVASNDLAVTPAAGAPSGNGTVEGLAVAPDAAFRPEEPPARQPLPQPKDSALPAAPRNGSLHGELTHPSTAGAPVSPEPREGGTSPPQRRPAHSAGRTETPPPQDLSIPAPLLLRLTAETPVRQDASFEPTRALALTEVWMQPGFSLLSVTTNFRAAGDALSGGAKASLTFTLNTRRRDARGADTFSLHITSGQIELQPPARTDPAFALRLADGPNDRLLLLSPLALPRAQAAADPATNTFVLDLTGLGFEPAPLARALAAHASELTLEPTQTNAALVLRRIEPESGRLFGDWRIPGAPAEAAPSAETLELDTPDREPAPAAADSRRPPLASVRWRGNPVIVIP